MRRMDIAACLRTRKQYLKRGPTNVSDFKVSDYSYIPDKAVMRDEMDEVFRHLIRFETGGIPAQMVICCSRGSGKTLILKYLQRTITQKTDGDVLHVNCRDNTTSFKMFSYFLEDEKTAGSSLDDSHKRFLPRYQERTASWVGGEISRTSASDAVHFICYRFCDCLY